MRPTERRVQDNTEDLIWESIDALMEELRQVVTEARKKVDSVDLLSYILYELGGVFRNAEMPMRNDVRLP